MSVLKKIFKMVINIYFKLVCFEEKVELLWWLDHCCHCHTKSMKLTKSFKGINTNLEHLLVMTTCSCKTRGITLKAFILELCPFLSLELFVTWLIYFNVPQKVLKISTPNLEYLLIMIRHSIKRRGITLKVILQKY